MHQTRSQCAVTMSRATVNCVQHRIVHLPSCNSVNSVWSLVSIESSDDRHVSHTYSSLYQGTCNPEHHIPHTVRSHLSTNGICLLAWMSCRSCSISTTTSQRSPCVIRRMPAALSAATAALSSCCSSAAILAMCAHRRPMSGHGCTAYGLHA